VTLLGQVVVVTGAASGIGAATAALLRDRGATVVGVDREPVDGLQKDLSVPEDVANVVPEVLSAHGRLDGLVNNAGLARHGAVIDLDLADLDLMWAVNVRALVHLTRDAMRAMPAGGTVVNVVSTAGLRGEPGESAYCATKAAVRGFTEAAAEEGRTRGVRVAGIYPAGVATGFWDVAVGNRAGFTGDKSWLAPSDVALQVVHVLETPAHIELPSLVVRHVGDADLAGIRSKLALVAR
jgi:NADP-dependent 3-hydroxy acid dehydrogenase YdfG